MKVIRQSEMVKTAAERFERQLGKRDFEGRWAKLNALDPDTVTAQEIDDIIGNRAWTAPWCNECEKYLPEAVYFGMDYEDHTLCAVCLQAALDLLTKNGE